MPTVKKRQTRRKHNPEILRYKRAARALGISWCDVTAERDRLRAHERLLREDDDTIRREAWAMYAGEQAAPWWRGAFQRKFAKLLREGGDCDQVPGWDELCQQLRSICPSVAEWTSGDIFDLVCSDYPPLVDVTEHYENAIRNLLGVTQAPASFDYSDTPF